MRIKINTLLLGVYKHIVLYITLSVLVSTEVLCHVIDGVFILYEN
jgi:hypothetical protein